MLRALRAQRVFVVVPPRLGEFGMKQKCPFNSHELPLPHPTFKVPPTTINWRSHLASDHSLRGSQYCLYFRSNREEFRISSCFHLFRFRRTSLLRCLRAREGQLHHCSPPIPNTTPLSHHSLNLRRLPSADPGWELQPLGHIEPTR